MFKIIELLKTIVLSLNYTKSVLTFDEGCRYCGISPSSMYKHTSSNRIPHYKPEGKLIYFKREELDSWMLRNRNSSINELEDTAASYSLKRIKS
ncbi:helix-turn-helix domain-containing protein [Winogradskyella poriferorum]|uniref:helix-turn-helix domain-containing protein n=1 Tax=Winogradskyella poriferorum TaxID=307627 RepID=UPI003D659CC9